MGVKDSFMGANMLIKIAFFVVLVGNFFGWISFTTTSWYVVTAGTFDTHLGLWRSCGSRGGGCTILDGTAYTEFGATQAFAIFGFVCLTVGFLLLVLFMFWGSCKGNSEAGMGSAILLIISAVAWLIAIIIFATEYEHFNTENGYGYSFGFAVVACLLALVGGILVIVGVRGGASVGSK